MKSKSVELHEKIPPRYYLNSIKRNLLQRFWHFQRFKNICELVDPVDGEILDIGCADGVFLERIVKKAKPKKAIGIDIVKSLVEDTKKRLRNNKTMEFKVADVVNLPFSDGRFDAVFCLEVLEHTSDINKAFKEISRVLKKKGYLIVLVPTDNLLFKICWWMVLHTWGKHWKNTHIHSFNRENNLSNILKKSGLIIEEDRKFILGMLNVVKTRKI